MLRSVWHILMCIASGELVSWCISWLSRSYWQKRGGVNKQLQPSLSLTTMMKEVHSDRRP